MLSSFVTSQTAAVTAVKPFISFHVPALSLQMSVFGHVLVNVAFDSLQMLADNVLSSV